MIGRSLAATVAAVIGLVLAAQAQTTAPLGPGSGGAGSSGGGSGTPCTATASALQYDDSGAFGCVTNATSNGTGIILGLGSLGSYPLTIGTSPTAGIFSANSGNLDVGANGAFIFRVSNGSGVTAEADTAFNWSDTGGNPAAAKDTGLSRIGAGIVGVGDGSAGDVSGLLEAAGIQGGSANALKFASGGAITVYNQSTTVTPAYAVCAASGANGTGGGQIDLDTSSTVCGLSSMLFKRDIAAFSSTDTANLVSMVPEITSHFAAAPALGDPLAEVMSLIPAQFRGDGEHITDTSLQLGLTAQNACAVDERICARFPDGSPRTFKPSGVIALLVAAVKRQQEEIKLLTTEVEKRGVIK